MPPRQHKHERQYTPSTNSVIPTIWNDDDDGQMIFGVLGGLKFPDICLTGEEKPRENLTQKICPDRGSNPGPLRDKRACYHLLHSGGLHHNFCKIIRYQVHLLLQVLTLDGARSTVPRYIAKFPV